jgi:prophage tail gpP-like protein
MLWLDQAEMLIGGVQYSLDDGGTRATLSLAAPEAFAQLDGVASNRLAGALRAKAEKQKAGKGDGSVYQ